MRGMFCCYTAEWNVIETHIHTCTNIQCLPLSLSMQTCIFLLNKILSPNYHTDRIVEHIQSVKIHMNTLLK